MSDQRRRPATLEPGQREALLACFRADDPDADPRAFYRASRATGLHRQTARRAWMEGAPPSQPPLRQVVAEERARARYRLSREALRDRVRSATDAIVEEGAKAREAEALVARSAMSVAAGLLGQLAAVAPDVEALVGAAVTAAAGAKDHAAGLAVAQRLVSLARSVTDLFGAAQAAERRALGEADLRVDLRTGPAPALTTAEAEREIALAARALRMVRESENDEIDGPGAARSN
jgi:hypothetical protein